MAEQADIDSPDQATGEVVIPPGPHAQAHDVDAVTAEPGQQAAAQRLTEGTAGLAGRLRRNS